MIIRKATKEDIDNNLLKLYIDGFKLHYNQRKDIFTDKDEIELKNDLLKTFNTSDETILVIEEDNMVIGYTSVQIKNRATKSLWIDEFIIDSNYRNNGYGEKLINKIFDYAKENSCQRVELNCWTFNTGALNFYNKFGFKEQRIVLEKDIN